MYGNNLTPVKTIGRDANQLMIYIDTIRIVSNPNCRMEIQVLEAYTDNVLATTGKQICGPNMSIKLHVAKGTKIQVYFRLYDMNGNYQDNYSAGFSYWYKYI